MEADTAAIRGDCAYTIASPQIISKIFEGELTIINMETGEYFAAGGIVLDLWTLLAEQITLVEMVGVIKERFEGDASTIAAEVTRLVDLLCAGKLIVATSRLPAARSAATAPAPQPWLGGWIEAYGDMKDLLLLDPVHDVGAAAWPGAPPNIGAKT